MCDDASVRDRNSDEFLFLFIFFILENKAFSIRSINFPTIFLFPFNFHFVLWIFYFIFLFHQKLYLLFLCVGMCLLLVVVDDNKFTFFFSPEIFRFFFFLTLHLNNIYYASVSQYFWRSLSINVIHNKGNEKNFNLFHVHPKWSMVKHVSFSAKFIQSFAVYLLNRLNWNKIKSSKYEY